MAIEQFDDLNGNKTNIRFPTLYEVESLLEGIALRIPVSFEINEDESKNSETSKQYEECFNFTKTTTIAMLFEDILKKSEIFKKFKVQEKRLYWIYVYHFNLQEYVSVYAEER